jgi:TolA-binding protein
MSSARQARSVPTFFPIWSSSPGSIRKDSRGATIYGFADRALRDRRYDAAIDAYDYFLSTFEKNNVLHTSVIFNYARALELKYREGGSTSRAEAEKLVDRYRQIASENRNTVPASEALLQIAILEGDDLDDPAEALKVLEELRRDYPRFQARAQALLLEGDMLLRTGDVARAQAIYRRGADTLQRGPDGERYRDLSALRLAETYFYQGEFKEAADRFTALTENTSSEATNDALQYLLILQENLEQNPVPLRSYATTGRLMMIQRKWKDAAEAMAKAASGVGAGSLADDALYAKGEAEEAMGESATAMQTMLEIVAKYPDGTVADRALYHAAGIAEQIPAERAKAIELYTRILTEYPRSTYVTPARKKIRSLRGES